MSSLDPIQPIRSLTDAASIQQEEALRENEQQLLLGGHRVQQLPREEGPSTIQYRSFVQIIKQKIASLVLTLFRRFLSENAIYKLHHISQTPFLAKDQEIAHAAHQMILAVQKSVVDRENDLKTVVGTQAVPQSQGFQASTDGSRVLFHDSTVPLNEYGPEFRNMDLGGVGQRDGLNFGVVCDGAGSSKSAMNAAQAFTQSLLKNLFDNAYEMRGSIANEDLKEQAIEMFEKAAFTSEGGNSTAVFVTFVRGDNGHLQVRGGAIGDSVALHIQRNGGSAEQLNTINKQNAEDKKDSGGQIVSGLGRRANPDLQNCSVFNRNISQNDIVVLASDGLTDNIYFGQLEQIVPLIIFSSKFDESVENLLQQDQPWLAGDKPGLPDINQMNKFVEGYLFDTNVDNETIARRLNTYVKFIADAGTKAAQKAVDDINAIYERADLSHAEKNEQVIQYRERVNAEQKLVSKTDDLMIVVLSPKGN